VVLWVVTPFSLVRLWSYELWHLSVLLDCGLMSCDTFQSCQTVVIWVVAPCSLVRLWWYELWHLILLLRPWSSGCDTLNSCRLLRSEARRLHSNKPLDQSWSILFACMTVFNVKRPVKRRLEVLCVCIVREFAWRPGIKSRYFRIRQGTLETFGLGYKSFSLQGV
jgi:hypothetical protein